VLKGKLVTLRAIEREDLPRLAELSNDLETLALATLDPPGPTSRAQMDAWFDRRLAEEKPDAVRFVIETSGTVIGVGQLYAFDDYARTCGLGISIEAPEYRGLGFGTECVRLLLDFAFRHRNRNKVWLETLADNGRAIRCFAKCGFVEEGRFREQEWHEGRFMDAVRMAILLREWEAAQIDEVEPSEGS
jgi:diamine N-acetyltransferase